MFFETADICLCSSVQLTVTKERFQQGGENLYTWSTEGF